MSDQSKKPKGEVDGADLRQAERVAVDIEVDCRDESNFLLASIKNLSIQGIFVETKTPVEFGTRLTLRFNLPISGNMISADGVVVWSNPYREGAENLNPGMGVRFVDLSEEALQKLTDLVRRIAYIDDDESPKN
jgi:type IV pilus assembly protein PilZ